MKKIYKYLLGSFVFVLVLLSLPFYKVGAATIGFSPSTETYKTGDTINLKVNINSNGTSVNAIAATIKFPNDILSLTSVSKTGSIINIWAQEPSFSNGDGTASFEGVILNGYNGTAGNAVTLIFRAKTAGIANIKFTTASVLANDGNGTEVLSSKGAATITISKAETPPVVVETPKTEVKEPVKKEETPVKTPVKDMTIVISEIKNNTTKYSPNKFLITSAQPVSEKTYNIQIDSMPTIIWTDDGTHVYQAPELTNGIHTIKIIAVDTSSNTLSGSLNFSTTVLKIPVITYYPTDLYVDQFLVLKGTADPSVDVELTITNLNTGGVLLDRVTTNSNGKFTYVPDNRILAGSYSIIARSIAANGINSEYMNPIQIVNKENKVDFFISKFSSYITLLIPFIGLIFIFVLLILYVHHRVVKYKIYLDKKLENTENIVAKSFELLDEDADEEIAIFRKIRGNKMLDKDEQIFLGKFKKDIKEAEKIIQKELKEIEKEK